MMDSYHHSQKEKELDTQFRVHGIIGEHPRILKVLKQAIRVADTGATVLIYGESGTGKEMIAQMLHRESTRADKSFVAVHCGAIAETLQESELFGHMKGAFTGATHRKTGLCEAADQGTIFLDEISEMRKDLQVKLLRVLQSGEYRPVGSTENRHCDMRVIAASNQQLPPLIEAGTFRRDLYYRLNVIRLEIPPLRERREDIPLLADHFLRMFSAAYQKSTLEVDSETMDYLIKYDFPGNVRELENIIQRAVILCRKKHLSLRHLPSEVLHENVPAIENDSTDFHQAKAHTIAEFERTYIASMLQKCGGIISRAAQCSGLSERNFHEKLKKYDISGKNYRIQMFTS